MAICLGCKFWMPDSETPNFGECRRNAPIPANELNPSENAFRGQSYNTFWPMTFEDDWCGEHVQRVEKEWDAFDEVFKGSDEKEKTE